MFRSVFAVLAATLALGALAASAQAATEGPFYKVSGTRLASGSTKVLTGKGFFEFANKGLGVLVSCHKEAFSSAKIAGSTGANAGTLEATIELSECEVEGNGPLCTVEGGKIKTTALKGTLGYATSTRTGRLLLLLKPATGSTFATVKFVGGEHCEWYRNTVSLLGGVIAALGTSTKPVEVGLNEAQAKVNSYSFPLSPPARIWTESAGSLTEVHSGLTLNGSGLAVAGVTELELESAPEWGVFT